MNRRETRSLVRCLVEPGPLYVLEAGKVVAELALAVDHLGRDPAQVGSGSS